MGYLRKYSHSTRIENSWIDDEFHERQIAVNVFKHLMLQHVYVKEFQLSSISLREIVVFYCWVTCKHMGQNPWTRNDRVNIHEYEI